MPVVPLSAPQRENLLIERNALAAAEVFLNHFHSNKAPSLTPLSKKTNHFWQNYLPLRSCVNIGWLRGRGNLPINWSNKLQK